MDKLVLRTTTVTSLTDSIHPWRHMKKTFVSAVTAVLLLIVLASLAFAAPSTIQVATPFRGTLQGSETHVPGVPGQTFVVTGNVSGTANHLGRYTLHYQIEVDLVSRASTNGHATFTAANGDMIFAEGHGQGKPSGTPGVSNPEEWYTITGGTGRFYGARGSYSVNRYVELATGVTWGEFDGTIVIPQGN